MNKCRNNGIKSVCGRVWRAFATHVDWIAIVASLAAIVLFFVTPNSAGWECALRVFGNLLALLGAGYWFYAIWLYLCRKVEFDHHLINGHFLRKVISLSLLTPFVITSLMSVFYLPDGGVAESVSVGEQVESGCEYIDTQEDSALLWAVLANFMDPGNQHLASTKSGRAWSTLIALLGMILLNGLLISSLISAIDRRKERWMDGEIVYSSRQLGRGRYAIVLGANEIASSVVKNLLAGHNSNDLNFKCEGNNRYVVLLTNRTPSEVRGELRANLTQEEADKVIVCNGLRNSKDEVSSLEVEYASEIYVLGESSLVGGGESFHDAVSMQCINILADLLEVGRPKREALKAKRLAQGRHYAARKVCKVLFEYQTTNSVLMFSDLPPKVKANLVIIPFNRYESWARKVIVEGKYSSADRQPIKYTFLDGAKGITDVNSPEYVHLVIVGMSKMGMALGLQAMLEAHYINYAKARTRITFIDTAADKEMNFFKGRYPNLFGLMRHRYFDANEKVEMAGGEIYGQHCATDWIDPIECADSKWSHLSENGKNFVDVEVEFVKGELESEGVRSYLEYMTDDKNSKLTIAICLTQSHQAIAASLYMPVCVYSKVQQVWVYQPDSQDIIYNQAHTEQRDFRYDKLVPFGMLYGEYVCDRSQYLQAMLVNIQYDLMAKEQGEGWAAGAQCPATLLDKMEKGYAAARESWKKLIVYKKLSNRYYADSIALKIRSVTTPENATLSLAERLEQYAAPLAECEHNRWTMQELLLGFSPCDKELDDLMRRNQNGEDVTEEYKAWKKRNKLADNSFRKIKDDMKECALRIHPNICDFDHLAKIDAGAQPYDAYLNKAIPTILELVKPIK